LYQPAELKRNEPLLWSAGNGTQVWELFCACATGDLSVVERLITENPSLVRAHHEYRTPLYFAVRENQMAVATFLLDRGANPFYNGDDLVEIARLRGFTDIEALLESYRTKLQGATMRQRWSAFLARDSSSDIWTAAYAGNTDRVRELLDRDPSLANSPGQERLGSPLVLAAGRGHLEVVRLLLERGADPNLPEEGNAPHGRALYSAVYSKHVDVARILLEHGANPNQEVESSADAPTIAIMNSDTAMIELLASYGGVWQIPVQLADS
jgi:ankyrin repeat protein